MKRLEKLKQQWEEWGEKDPLWAVMTRPGTKGGRWDQDEFFATGERDVQRFSEYLGSVGAWPIGGRALDFACGVGRLTQAFAPHFDEVVGVDISERMIAHAEACNRFPERVHYRVNNAPDLSIFNAEEFDFVYSHIALQHIHPDLGFAYVSEMVRVLKPGGILMLQAVSGVTRTVKGFATALTPAAVRKVAAGMDMHAYPRRNMVVALESRGLDILLIRRDAAAGDRWISLQYLARKAVL